MSGPADSVDVDTAGQVPAGETADMMRDPMGAEQAPTSGEATADPVDELLARVRLAPATARNSAVKDADIAMLGKLGKRDPAALADALQALGAAGAKVSTIHGRLRGIRAVPSPAPRSTSNVNDGPRRRDFERGDDSELGARLVESLAEQSDAAPVADRGDLYTYSAETGAWSKVTEDTCSRIIQGFTSCFIDDGKKSKPVTVQAKSVKGAIKLAMDRAMQTGFFDAPAPGFAFSNGFVRCGPAGVEVVPHSPDHAVTLSYPFPYDGAAPAPRWRAALETAFRGDHDAAQKIACLQELGGASLFGRAAKYHRAIMLWGTKGATGRNGKSTIAFCMKAAFPKDAVSAIPPQALEKEYQRAQLAGKLFNVVGETPEADVLDGGAFKACIAGDSINARQPCGRSFDFEPCAGHLMMANTLFGTNDHSLGFWERWIVITFNRAIPESEQIAGLHDAIIADELPGIVAWMIEGAVRIMVNGGRYTIPESSRDAVDAWRRRTNSVALFIEERTVPALTLGSRTPARVLFDAYSEWAARNKLGAMSSVKFGMRMTGLGYEREGTAKCDVYPRALLLPNEEKPGSVAAPGVCSVCTRVRGNRDDGACEPCPSCGKCFAVNPADHPDACRC